MSLFEFILVMVSLVLAIAMTHLLEGVARVVRERRRFEVDRITPVWAAFLFVLSIAHWWSLWDMREADWTFPAFFFVLLPPTLLFLAVSLLTPEDGDDEVSLEDDFLRIRVPFLGVLFAFAILVTWDGYLLGVEGAWNRLRTFQLALLANFLVGLASPSRRVQRLVAAIALALLVGSSFVLRFLPGAFSP